MEKFSEFGNGMPLAFRLGFATRGNTAPATDDVLLAFDRGVNYWNWCGYEDGISRAVRELGDDRPRVIVATQISASGWTRDGMRRQLDEALEMLATDWVDVVTLYYVESNDEWSQITREGGAMEALLEAKAEGRVRAIGLTTHQRPLAAKWAKTGLLDMLMVRYNAAHRGAETEVFPITRRRGLPVVCFTCLRWGALMKPTGREPDGFAIPGAEEWYRFVLSNPAVDVALMAPNNREELLRNLSLVDDWRATSAEQQAAMKEHGDRVRETAGPFP